MRDGWRLRAGTFLVIPVRPPDRVDRTVAGRAMVLAPATAFPAAAVWLGLGLVARNGWLTPLLAAGLAVTTTALLSRAMHLDGLADLADGLTSGPSRSRALEVMAAVTPVPRAPQRSSWSSSCRPPPWPECSAPPRARPSRSPRC